MKKIFLAIIILLSVFNTDAQLSTNLVLSANPPGSLFDWGLKKEILSYVVVNQSGTVDRFLIKAEIKMTDGTVIGNNNLAKAQLLSLGGASRIFSASDVIPMDNMIFSGKYKTSLDKTGKLPAGTYQLCVRLVLPGTYQPISEERCRIFNLAAYQLPIPISPLNEQVLKPELAQSAITFRWTPVSPIPNYPVTYRLLVFEVLENQKPIQALKSNMPLLNKDVIGTTQYIWQPQLGWADLEAKNKTRTFVWTLQCLDNMNQPIIDGNVNGDGISEPIIFYVGKEKK